MFLRVWATKNVMSYVSFKYHYRLSVVKTVVNYFDCQLVKNMSLLNYISVTKRKAEPEQEPTTSTSNNTQNAIQPNKKLDKKQYDAMYEKNKKVEAEPEEEPTTSTSTSNTQTAGQTNKKLEKKQYDAMYEKNKRIRKFLPAWRNGRNWLQDSEEGMSCKLCTVHKEVLLQQRYNVSSLFTKTISTTNKDGQGCKSYKSESIVAHEQSETHKQAVQIESQLNNPESKAKVALKSLHKQALPKMRILFRNAHALVKYKHPFTDIVWLCKLDQAKGLPVSNYSCILILLMTLY